MKNKRKREHFYRRHLRLPHDYRTVGALIAFEIIDSRAVRIP
jgi:hypothetical protein